MSARPLLFIGNRNYSSWSLRAELALAAAGIEHDCKLIQLDTESSAAELAASSPSAKVPALRMGDVVVWESLAIAEWAVERCPDLWPSDDRLRGHARSASAEMHAGFAGIRSDMPMNIRGRFPGVGHSERALGDARRILELWGQARRLSGNATFLYGEKFAVADAMYAPVVTRFLTYNVPLDDDARSYCEAVCRFPAMAQWIAEAAEEPWTCEVSEPGSRQWTGGPLSV